MYKFNFLSKINQDKLEAKKRERFIKMIFSLSTISIILVLVVLYIQSTLVHSSYKDAQDYENRLKTKTVDFRKKDFFSYRIIQNVYNSNLERRKMSLILNTLGSALDSTIILNDLIFYENFIETTFITRSSASKSQMMVIANNLKNIITEKLIELGYFDEKKPITLAKGPDIKKSYDDYQYWVFNFNINLSGIPGNASVKAKTETPS